MSAELGHTATDGARLAPSRRMRATFLRELGREGLSNAPPHIEIVTEGDLAALPATVARYMRFMGVVGRPKTWSFRLRSTGRFRLGPDQSYMPCEAWQYNSALGTTRIFHMRLRYGGILPMLVRDIYVRGHGRMRGRLFDTIDVVDESNRKIDTGELVTYVNDAILLAPAMLLRGAATFRQVDEASFDVVYRDGDQTVAARVLVDERGAVTDFSTTDRFVREPGGAKEMIQARWSTPVWGWTRKDGRSVPTGGAAIWHLRAGDFTYAELRFEELEYDVAP